MGPRFSELKPGDLNAAQKPLAERIERGLGRPGLGGPFSIMLRSPGMAVGLIESFEYNRLHTKLDPRVKEFATLIVAREWTAQFEWYAHRPAAERAGLAPSIIEALRVGKRPPAMSPDDTAIYDFFDRAHPRPRGR